MDDMTDSPRKVASEEELVEALMSSRGLTREQAVHQARAAMGGWTDDLVGVEQSVDPTLIFPRV